MEGGRRTDRDEAHGYWRRYLDEAVWEPVDVGVVERALSDVYRDVSLAMEVNLPGLPARGGQHPHAGRQVRGETRLSCRWWEGLG